MTFCNSDKNVTQHSNKSYSFRLGVGSLIYVLFIHLFIHSIYSLCIYVRNLYYFILLVYKDDNNSSRPSVYFVADK